MANSKGKKPTRTAGRRPALPVTLSLAKAERMLPLIQQIARDIRDRWLKLTQIEREQGELDKKRHTLDWAGRSRRYQIADEIAGERRHLQDAVTELEQLNALLVDPVQGEIAFPTQIQGKRAYYVWTLADEQIEWWCYANEPNRRAVPPTWRKRRERGRESLESATDGE